LDPAVVDENFESAIVDFSKTFAPQSASADQVLYTAVGSPLDQETTLRLAQRKVANVYAGTSVDASAYLPTRQGVSTLIEYKHVFEVISDSDTTRRMLAPVRLGLSFTTPSHGFLTASMVVDMISDLLGLIGSGQGVVDDDTYVTAGIGSLLHGVKTKG